MDKQRLQELAGITETALENTIDAANMEGEEHALQMIKTAKRLSGKHPEWAIDIMLDRMREMFQKHGIPSHARITRD